MQATISKDNMGCDHYPDTVPDPEAIESTFVALL